MVLLCPYILFYKKISSVLVISLRQMGLSTLIASAECEMMIIPSRCEVKSKPKFPSELGYTVFFFIEPGS